MVSEENASWLRTTHEAPSDACYRLILPVKTLEILCVTEGTRADHTPQTEHASNTRNGGEVRAVSRRMSSLGYGSSPAALDAQPVGGVGCSTVGDAGWPYGRLVVRIRRVLYES